MMRGCSWHMEEEEREDAGPEARAWNTGIRVEREGCIACVVSSCCVVVGDIPRLTVQSSERVGVTHSTFTLRVTCDG